MRAWVLALLVTASVAVQSSLVDKLAVWGVKPDLPLLLTLSIGLLYGWRSGAVVGLAAGLLQDLLLGRYLGLNALALGLTGALVGLAEPRIWKENLLVVLLGSFAGTVFAHLAEFLTLLVFGRPVEFLVTWRTAILPGAVYNSLLGPILYWQIYRSVARWQYQTGKNVR